MAAFGAWDDAGPPRQAEGESLIAGAAPGTAPGGTLAYEKGYRESGCRKVANARRRWPSYSV